MADDSEPIGQDDIEALLAAADSGGAAPSDPSEPAAAEAAVPADDGFALGQNEIEALMAGGAPATTPPSAPAADAPSGVAPPVSSPGATNDVSLLLDQAQAAIASIDETGGDLPDGVQPFRLESFGGTPPTMSQRPSSSCATCKLDLKIELGRTRMPLEDVLRLRRDAVVTLDKLAGDPVDVYANGRLIARGEVLVLNDNFCVRDGADRRRHRRRLSRAVALACWRPHAIAWYGDSRVATL